MWIMEYGPNKILDRILSSSDLSGLFLVAHRPHDVLVYICGPMWPGRSALAF